MESGRGNSGAGEGVEVAFMCRSAFGGRVGSGLEAEADEQEGWKGCGKS